MFSRREKEPAQVLSLPPTPPRHDHPFAATSSATERIPWKTNVGEETDPRMAVRLLDVQLSTVKLGEARSLGVSEEWMQRFGRYSDRQQMLRIDAIFPTTPKLKGPLPHGT